MFRQPPGMTPYDHTSILATVRDWLKLDMDKLTSQRVAKAPNILSVLTRTTPRDDDIPLIKESRACSTETHCLPAGEKLSDLQKSIVGALAHHRAHSGPVRRAVKDVLAEVNTIDDAIKYLADGDWPAAFKKKES